MKFIPSNNMSTLVLNNLYIYHWNRFINRILAQNTNVTLTVPQWSKSKWLKWFFTAKLPSGWCTCTPTVCILYQCVVLLTLISLVLVSCITVCSLSSVGTTSCILAGENIDSPYISWKWCTISAHLVYTNRTHISVDTNKEESGTKVITLCKLTDLFFWTAKI